MSEISVIIPVYNVEDYLDECLESILSQTFSDFELLLIDDGSTDRSPVICEQYKNRDSRIRVFHRKNQGQAAARNFAVKQSTSEWIVFIDSDDVIVQRYLEQLYIAVKENDVLISLCDASKGDIVPENFGMAGNHFDIMVRDVDDNLLYDYRYNDLFKYYDVWGKLIHRSIVEEVPFTSGRIYEDAEVTCQWLYMAGKVAEVRMGGGIFIELIQQVQWSLCRKKKL